MPNVMPASPAHTWPVWPLPLLAGLLPLAATVVAYTLSVRLGLIEPCNPFLEGCVSISRAARHGLPNALFRAMVLPAAVLQALCWILYAASLRTRGAHPTWRLAALPWIGLLAAIFLMLYGSFLGTEGAPYRWMRRFGVTVYFGGTCLAMLIAAGAARGLAARQRWEARLMLPLAVSLPMLGLVNAFAPMLDGSAEMEAALQNVSEWWAGLVLTAFFFALAALWRKTRFELR